VCVRIQDEGGEGGRGGNKGVRERKGGGVGDDGLGRERRRGFLRQPPFCSDLVARREMWQPPPPQFVCPPPPPNILKSACNKVKKRNPNFRILGVWGNHFAPPHAVFAKKNTTPPAPKFPRPNAQRREAQLVCPTPPHKKWATTSRLIGGRFSPQSVGCFCGVLGVVFWNRPIPHPNLKNGGGGVC